MLRWLQCNIHTAFSFRRGDTGGFVLKSFNILVVPPVTWLWHIFMKINSIWFNNKMILWFIKWFLRGNIWVFTIFTIEKFYVYIVFLVNIFMCSLLFITNWLFKYFRYLCGVRTCIKYLVIYIYIFSVLYQTRPAVQSYY